MKQRLDSLIEQRGLAANRHTAVSMILAGEVSSRDQLLTKPGFMVEADIEIALKERSRYVSRGGAKLSSVARQLKLNFTNKTVLDVGASTGGFTDYALQAGAKKVYAVDVGTAQLAYRLRQDPRVVVMEKTDIRSIEKLSETIDIVVIDVSFISLTQILAAVTRLVGTAPIVAMAKPQFEAPKGTTDSTKGVIRDQEVRSQVLKNLETDISEQFKILKSADSGLAGTKGNIERFYLLQAKRPKK